MTPRRLINRRILSSTGLTRRVARLAVVAALVAAGAGTVVSAPPARAIVDGYARGSEQLLGQVQLWRTPPGSFFSSYYCTGTAISSRWVLIAKHCVDDQQMRYQVFSGLAEYGVGTSSQVDRTVMNAGNDAALLHLASPTREGMRIYHYGWRTPPLGTSMNLVAWGGNVDGGTAADHPRIAVGSRQRVGVASSTYMYPPLTPRSNAMYLYPLEGRPYFGDSGAGVIDDADLVCGVIASGNISDVTRRLSPIEPVTWATTTDALATWIVTTTGITPDLRHTCDGRDEDEVLDDLTETMRQMTIAESVQHGDIRIMPMGDSLTKGIGSASGNAFRKNLFAQIGPLPGDFDFVGGAPPSGDVADPDNEGHADYRIDEIAALVDDSMQRYKPNVVTLTAGTSDLEDRYDVDGAPGRLAALVDKVLAADSEVQVLVALIPASTDTELEPLITAYNSAITLSMESRERVTIVDTGNITSTTDMSDTVHPNDSGYDKMGRDFAIGLDGLIVGGRLHNPRPLPGSGSGSVSGLRVMPLGSSTTNGDHSTDGNGYRQRLDAGLEKLVEARASGDAQGLSGDLTPHDATPRVDMVGSVRYGTMTDRDHEGWSGYTLDTISGKAKCAVPVYRPNLVTLIAGGNNVIKNYQMSTALNQLDALIRQVQIDSPAATVLVANMQHFHDPAIEARGVSYSAGIPKVVDRLAAEGRHVMFVDTGLTPAEVSDDDVHPIDSGYAKIADAFLKATAAAFDRGWIEPAGPQASNAASSPCGVTDRGTTPPIGVASSAGGATTLTDKRWEDHGVSFNAGFGTGNSYRWGDVNGDKKPELFVVKPDQSWTFYWNGGRTDKLWTSWGKGFSRAAPGGGKVGNALRLADIDGDGAVDCVRVDHQGGISVSTWDKSKPVGEKLCGTAFVGEKVGDPSLADTQIVFADIDGDNRDDYLLVERLGTTHLWLNRKTGWIKGGQIAGPATEARIRRWADIDKNGRADQILITAAGGARAWLNEGISQNAADGTVKVKLKDIGAILADTNLPPSDISFVDVGGDGNADLVRTGHTGVTHIWLNRTGLKPVTTTDGRIRALWEDHGVSFKDGFGEGKYYQLGNVNTDDRRPEFFVVKPDGSFSYYWNHGPTATGWSAWTFAYSRKSLFDSSDPGEILRLGHFDDDGIVDCMELWPSGEIGALILWYENGPVGEKLCGEPGSGGGGTTVPIEAGTQSVLVDLDADGMDEFLLIKPDGTTNAWKYSNYSCIADLCTKGLWGFRHIGEISGPSTGPKGVVRWADLNGDRIADKILITAAGGARAWMNDGPLLNTSGRYDSYNTELRDIGRIMDDTGLPPADMRYTDMDGDGKVDLLRVGHTGVTHIWLNTLQPEYFKKFHP